MRGKGIGAELVNKLTAYVFETLKKERVILNVYSWNTQAIKCYEQAGFTKTDKIPSIAQVGKETWEIIEMGKTKIHSRFP